MKQTGTIPPEINLQAILDQRGSRYGDFRDNALVSQRIKQILHDALTDNEFYKAMPLSDQFVVTEGLDNIALKLSRIVTGDPAYDDNWTDVAGFSTITRDRVCTSRNK